MNDRNGTESFDHEYDWLVREDVATWRPADDAGTLVSAGARRLRRRRRGIAAGVSGLVAAAVAVPVLALGGTSTAEVPQVAPDPTAVPAPYAGTDRGPDNAPEPEPSTLRGCGYFACVEDAGRDVDPILGELLEVGDTPSGVPQVVWASQRELVDPRTHRTIVGPVIMGGFLDGEQRLDSTFMLQPGHEFLPGCEVQTSVHYTFQDGWSVVGYVEGPASEVTYDGGSGDGSTITSTRVLAGLTVFFAEGPGDELTDFPTSFTATTPDGPRTGVVGECGMVG